MANLELTVHLLQIPDWAAELNQVSEYCVYVFQSILVVFLAMIECFVYETNVGVGDIT